VQRSAHRPDWPSIDTVLLDMDGTLLDLGFDNHFWEQHLPRRYAASRGVTLDEARSLIEPIFESTRGTLDWYCVHYWSRALELDILAMSRAARHDIEWLPQSRAFLARLRAAGRRIVLVTNAHPEVFAIKDAHLGIRRRFDAVYSSHEFGAPKESAEFWPAFARREGFDRDRTLFADDSLPVLRAARSHGIRWLYAVRRPVGRKAPREAGEFAGVESVLELAEGLTAGGKKAQAAGP
jgi:5'-nucleotidase